ncbi:MAG: hypothetical protein WBE47_08060, partial [Candidatus Acidiferrales bacterium]
GRTAMHRDERDLLEVLKAELEFLGSGGYAHTAGESWRPAYIFEDSPACMNHGHKENPAPCGDCVLMQLVPPEFRGRKSACRHIALNASGETLDSLYRYGDEREIEAAVKNWLQETVANLEQRKRMEPLNTGEPTSLKGQGQKGVALHEDAKCANPACQVSFEWRRGGKFFRFREPSMSSSLQNPESGASGVHGVRHYWLCERCSHLFTLAYEENSGVVLKISWPELAAAGN